MNPPVSASPDKTPAASDEKRPLDFGQFVSRGFNFAFVLVSCCLLVFVPFSSNKWNIEHRALWLVAAMLGDLILVQGFKHLCYVPRPKAQSGFCWGRRAHSGFPSGHTLPAFLLATLIVQAHSHLWFWFWFAGAALIGWARWKVLAHFGYQVLLSAALGIGLGLLAGRFL